LQSSELFFFSFRFRHEILTVHSLSSVAWQVSFGEMVGCDNPDCKVEWFHFECVGLTLPPKGKWYSPPPLVWSLTEPVCSLSLFVGTVLIVRPFEKREFTNRNLLLLDFFLLLPSKKRKKEKYHFTCMLERVPQIDWANSTVFACHGWRYRESLH
jgi:hypothetical protein